MTTEIENNIALVHRLYDHVMGEGDEQVAREIWAEDFVDHDVPGLGDGGREEVIAVVMGVRAAFPDITPTIHQAFGQDDLVCVRVTATGTHTGAPFPPGIPSSGKRMTWKEVHIFRCSDNRIIEHWGVFDMLGIYQELEAIEFKLAN